MKVTSLCVAALYFPINLKKAKKTVNCKWGYYLLFLIPFFHICEEIYYSYLSKLT